ncbi:MAG: 50S ribosomal protein L10 [Candidatus Wildermuthbacteria bacterium]|nr:50S ribosomal protein L10 [Candidatus Wildermuthbacteria bacterium]
MKTKAQKQEIIQNISENLAKQKAMVFVDFAGLKVKELLGFRKQLKQAGATIQVVKKTLFQRSLKDKNIDIDTKKLQGQVAAIFAFQDPVTPIKTAYQFAKRNERLKVLGGYFENTVYDKASLQEIANLPTKEQMLGVLVGTIAAPVSGFLNVLQGNIKGLVVALSAIKK